MGRRAGGEGGTSRSHRRAVSGSDRRSIQGAWSGKKGGWRSLFPFKLPQIVVFLRPGENGQLIAENNFWI